MYYAPTRLAAVECVTPHTGTHRPKMPERWKQAIEKLLKKVKNQKSNWKVTEEVPKST